MTKTGWDRARLKYVGMMERARVAAAWTRFLLYLKSGHERWAGDRSHKMASRKKRKYNVVFKGKRARR